MVLEEYSILDSTFYLTLDSICLDIYKFDPPCFFHQSKAQPVRDYRTGERHRAFQMNENKQWIKGSSFSFFVYLSS